MDLTLESPASNSTKDGEVKDDDVVFDFRNSENEDEVTKNKDDNDGKKDNGDDDRSYQRRRQQGAQQIASLLVDQLSQQSYLSHKTPQSQQSHSQSQAMSEMLTQNADFTQMTQDDTDGNGLILSPFPPGSPIKPQHLPWGRVMQDGLKAVDLLPRGPELSSQQQQQKQPLHHKQRSAHFTLLGMAQLRPFDIFNVYGFGRSQQNDFVAPKPNILAEDKELESQKWAYGMISNRHCRIYCTLPEDPRAASMPGSNVVPAASMEVWVEDSSNNGTMINQTILLKRGQKRRLHSGDEISLVNAEILSRRIRSTSMLQRILQQHSFVFVNVAHQQQQNLKQQQQSQANPKPLDFLGTLGSFPVPTSSAKRRKGLVNPRAMNYAGVRRSTPPLKSPPLTSTNQPQPLAMPTPKNGSCSNGKQAYPSSAANQHGHSSNLVNDSVSNPDRRRVSSTCTATTEPLLPRRIEQDYDIRDLLGRGTCGEVRRAIHRQSGKELAVKVISLPPPGLVNRKQQHEAQQWQAEARILQTLDHPYVVKLADVFCTDTHLYLVMELCSGGDLFDRIIKEQKYSEYDSRRVMRRLLSAMHYIHEDCNLVHRDIKPENILLTGANDPCDLKITDFGVAKSANEGLKTFCGTPLYFAPEVLKRRHTVHGQGRYGKAADVWSLGVILYIILSGTPPYDIDGASGMDVILKSSVKIPFHPEQWDSVSPAAIDLIRKMLVKDPRKRITIREACEHPWILAKDDDTHQHPLEDPKLISVTRKRLFVGGSPMPSSMTMEDSPVQSPARKRRRKVSMESSARVSKCKSGEPVASPKDEVGLLDVSMDGSETSDQLDDSKFNQPSDVSPAVSPPVDAAVTQLSRPMLSVIDDNASKSVKDSPSSVVPKADDSETKGIEEKSKMKEMSAPETTCPQKLSSKLAESLKASILSCAQNKVPIGTTIKKASIRPAAQDEKRNGSVSGPSRASTERTEAPAPKIKTASIRPPKPVNAEKDNDAPAGTTDPTNQDNPVCKYEEISERPTVTPKNKRHSKNKGKGDSVDVIIAGELDEDEICSQFSDDAGCMSADKGLNVALGKESRKMTQLKLTSTAPSSSSDATTIALDPLSKTGKSTAGKVTNGATKNAKSKAKNGKSQAKGKVSKATNTAGSKKQRTLMDMWKATK